jgi:hypothetical protein
MTTPISFFDAVTELQSILLNDTGLKTFVETAWKKPLTVKIEFKHRVEIKPADCPIIQMTVPDMKLANRLAGDRRNNNTVKLYCGFHNPESREKAQELMIKFSEALDDVITLPANHTLNGKAKRVEASADVVTDEGAFHPIYFFIMHLTIVQERGG